MEKVSFFGTLEVKLAAIGSSFQAAQHRTEGVALHWLPKAVVTRQTVITLKPSWAKGSSPYPIYGYSASMVRVNFLIKTMASGNWISKV